MSNILGGHVEKPVLSIHQGRIVMPDSAAGEAKVVHRISDDVVFLTYTGKITGREIIRARGAFLNDPGYRMGTSFLVDFTGASLELMNYSEVRIVADHGMSIDARLGKHRTAVVAPRDLEFGVSRMFQVLGQRPNLTYAVFRDEESALDWLRSPE